MERGKHGGGPAAGKDVSQTLVFVTLLGSISGNWSIHDWLCRRAFDSAYHSSEGVWHNQKMT
jgi:hypothetical protein